MTDGRLLANELGMRNYLTFYTSASILFAFITRIVNTKLFIKVSYNKKIFFLMFLEYCRIFFNVFNIIIT